MQRIFTMRRTCKFLLCRRSFTIASSNHWYCGSEECTKRRRAQDYAEKRARETAGQTP